MPLSSKPSMPTASRQFIARTREALADEHLRIALDKAETGFVNKRRRAIDEIGAERFDAMRARGQQAKKTAIAQLPEMLEQFEREAVARGSRVHWAVDGEACNRTITDILRRANCRRVLKGKSMAAEETGLNQALRQAGFVRTETDLGEYIIQLADEPPSHIIAPAVHKNRAQIRELFLRHHVNLPAQRKLANPADMVREARGELRDKYLQADAGIIGSNLLVAATGASLLVTNEGNGDLCATLPRVLIVVAGIEKLVADMEDAFAVIRLLARSATGQSCSNYTSFYSGPQRKGEVDGPQEMHFILLDNGRSSMPGEGFAEMLHCIRCGACLNHCPIYGNIGGHAYGWVYPGPMGSVLSPLLDGEKIHAALPNASTFCGRCEEVCPMGIPLPALLRRLRQRQYAQGIVSPFTRLMLGGHAWLIARPGLNRLVNRLAVWWMRLIARGGRLPRWANPPPWRKSRVMPAPQGRTMSKLARELEPRSDG